MSVTKVDKNKYRIFISDGTNLDGSRRRYSKTVTTDLTGRDLKRFLMEAEFDFEDEVKKKDPKFHELSKGSFKEYSHWWLQYKKIHDNLEDTTLTFHKRLLDTRILALIGSKSLSKITNGDMLELMKEIKKSPAKTKTGKLSSKYVKHHHILLKTMFNDAIKLKILTENPMDNVPVESPKVILKDNYYDLEDIERLLKLVTSEDIKYQLATLIGLSVGLRIGEITGLEWRHIDLENRTIKIEQANAYTNDKGSFIKSVKNEHSERTVKFPSSLIELFNKHKENESLKKELLGKNWEGSKKDLDDFVFTQENGKCIFIGTIPKWFRDLLREYNLKYITFHGLRHTNATLLISEGTPVISIAKNLGHAKTSTTTDFYAHHLESVEDKMANTFENILIGSGCGSKKQRLRIVK